jgi:spore germination protein GerM
MKIFASKRWLAACLMALTLLATAGCDQGQGTGNSSASSGTVTKVQEKQEPQAEKKEEKKAQPQEFSINVYYPNADGTKLIAVKRKVKSTAAEDKYTAAVKSLMQGTKEKSQTAIIPKQAKLRSVKVEGGVAKVDFSQDLVKHFVGGSTGEEMLVGSIVNTLTEFPEVKQVQILIEGSPVETIAGHMDLSTPLERMKDLL